MKENYLTAVRMLEEQLKEEEENYKNVLTRAGEFAELKRIKQRINSLKESLDFFNDAPRIISSETKVFEAELF